MSARARRHFPVAIAALLSASLLPSANASASTHKAPASPPTPATPTEDSGPAGPLHVPSPDWRDQVIYFLMIDRFDDGDRSNNDQGAGEFNPSDGSRYSGGDLKGVIRRLDYIRGLGATAVWMTPPVANQWLNPGASYGGYHGYWAEDFARLDAHAGTLEDYRALSRALHGSGMYLVQDVVVNHVGDWLECTATNTHTAAATATATEDATDTAPDCSVRADPRGRAGPSQAPFDRNDPRDPIQRREDIYHWRPDIGDFTQRRQELDFALAGLDDLNTENPTVRDALRASYGHWIREVGVDAFRVDTAFHVPADFFPDFLHSGDADAPGVVSVAAATGRHDFLSFGEGFGSDKPFDDAQARKLDSYMRVPGGLSSMINFPLYGTLGDVFARGRPTRELGHRIESMMSLHADPHRMPSFIDNHDVERFLSGGSQAALKQALLAMLTLPGIPVIYYGTEQGFTQPRTAMFAGGHGSTRDRFDTGAPLYRYLQRAIALRRGHKVFSRGVPTVLASNPASPGAFAYRMDAPEVDGNGASTCRSRAPTGADADACTGSTALVIFNTADTPALLDNLNPGLLAGTVLRGLFAIDGAGTDGAPTDTAPTDATPTNVVIGADRTLTLTLPPRSGQVWAVGGRVEPGRALPSPLTIDPPTAASQPSMARGRRPGNGPPEPVGSASPTFTGDFRLSGRARPGQRLQLVVNGRLADVLTVQADPEGRWQSTVRTDGMTDPAIEHRVVVLDSATGAVSPARTFHVNLDWQLLADIDDPRGDDAGPTGRYTYPLDPAWRDRHPADIERVRVWTAGGALRFELTLRSLSTDWNPANGFDHVAFTAYLQVPSREGGATVMPQQHASLPADMRWHYRLRAHGWSNVLTAAPGASAPEEGAPVTPTADIQVDQAARTVTFTLPADALGQPHSLAGATLHLTTWDYDGGYRPLAPHAGPTTFGGGSGTPGPLVMDAATVTFKR